MPSGPDEVLPICIDYTSAPVRCSWRIKNAPSMSFTGSPFRLVFCGGCFKAIVPLIILRAENVRIENANSLWFGAGKEKGGSLGLPRARNSVYDAPIS